MRGKLPAFIIVLFMINAADAATPGTEGASFLTIPIGGRPAALGGAYSALSTDAYAPVYNPAGYGFLKRPQLAAMHIAQMESVSYEFASLAYPFIPGTAGGLAVQYLRPGDITALDSAGNPGQDFSGSFMAVSLGLGHAFGDAFSLGVVGKLIRAKIADESAQSPAADVGGMFRVGPKVMLSGAITNIGKDLKFINEGDPLPTAYVLGGAFTPVREWVLALQGSSTRDGVNRTQAGVEWNPVELISIRAGYRTDLHKQLDSAAGFTAGVGLHLSGQQFDYAFVSSGDLGYTQYFSAVFQGGGPPMEKEVGETSSGRRKQDKKELNYWPSEENSYEKPAGLHR